MFEISETLKTLCQAVVYQQIVNDLKMFCGHPPGGPEEWI